MGSSLLGFIVWISFLLATNHSSVLANLTNTTLYSTHRQVTYAPESCCIKDIFGGCMHRYDPFTMSTYVDPNSRKRTFFQTSSQGNEPDSPNMKRRVEISFYGQAVYVYSPPRAQLDNLPGRIQISLNGLVLETIDLEAKYDGTDDNLWSPQLIYHWQGVNVDASHTLQITLLDSASDLIRGFGIDSVVYTSLVPQNPPRYELSVFQKLEEVTIQDTDSVMIFTPTYAWEKHISAFISSQGNRTFHGTSNKLAYASHNTIARPVAEFPARCAGLAIYGASPIQIEATFADGFRHGHLQICRGMTCEYIDAHQAYLHVPEHLRDEPVLIYSTDRISPRSLQPVKMRFLDPPSPVGHLWTATFSHAVCSQVVPKWPIMAAILAAVVNIVFMAVAVVVFAIVAVVAFAAVAAVVFAAFVVVARICEEWWSALSRRLEGSRSGNGQPLPDGTHGRYQLLVYNGTNPWPPGSSSQFASDAFRPAVRAVRPFPLTATDSDILPQYFDRTAPPSYDAHIMSDAVITTPPRPHAPITVPAPPPPQRT